MSGAEQDGRPRSWASYAKNQKNAPLADAAQNNRREAFAAATLCTKARFAAFLDRIPDTRATFAAALDITA
jgi:hypothetical protein